MEYYGLRRVGRDIDLIASKEDIANLIAMFPDRVKDLWGDLGVCPSMFEIWKTVNLRDYAFYADGAAQLDGILMISAEKLLVMKALAIGKEKYRRDVELLSKYLNDSQMKFFKTVRQENRELLAAVPYLAYLEKTGPEESP